MLYPSEEALTPEAGAAPGDPRRPHRARLGLPDRDARPRAARRRRPARRRAVGPRRRDRLRALRRDARRGGRGAARGRRRRAAPTRPRSALDVDVDAYVPVRLRPVRGGEDRRPPPHRRRPRARRAARAARRAARPLRPAAGAGRGLLALQRARIELGRAGARTAEVRGGRFAATPLELDSARSRDLRERIPEAIYESGAKTLAAPGPERPGRAPGGDRSSWPRRSARGPSPRRRA